MIAEKSKPKKTDDVKDLKRQTIKSLPLEVHRSTFFDPNLISHSSFSRATPNYNYAVAKIVIFISRMITTC